MWRTAPTVETTKSQAAREVPPPWGRHLKALWHGPTSAVFMVNFGSSGGSLEIVSTLSEPKLAA